MDKRGRIAAVLGALVVSVFFAGAARPATVASPLGLGAGAAVAGELLVKFKSSTDLQAQAAVLSARGDQRMRAGVGSAGFSLVKLSPGATLASAMAAYAAMPEVETVQPNYRYRLLAVPNDPDYGQLWGLNNTGQAVTGATFATTRVAGEDMDLQPAWDQITDCRPVIVAVVDTGVNYTHQDIAANMWDGSAAGFPNHGTDIVDGDNDPLPADAEGHGTHVAGTIGAVGNNGIGITGVCWQAQIMAVRAGGRGGLSTADIIQGIQFAVTNGAKVINMSFGGSSLDPAFETEIQNARTAGVIFVAAAGNDGTDNDSGTSPVYPCDFPEDNLICVAALDQAFSKASFSNFGQTSVDVGAPGVNVLSVWPGATITDDFSSGWNLSGGWSIGPCNFTGGTFPTLSDPSTWCASPRGQYANNADDVAYKNFDLSASGTVNAEASVERFLDTESGGDFLSFAASPTGGDPFASGTVIGSGLSGTTNGLAVEDDVNLDGCLTAACTFGFRLTSNGSVTDFGVGLVLFSIDTTQTNSNVYHVLNGTSMATPHVAGLAALVWSYNPNYTYLDVLNAIERGGRSLASLANITSTGRAADAAGALRYIEPPSGVTASVTLPP